MAVWLDQYFTLDVAPTKSQHLPANDICFFFQFYCIRVSLPSLHFRSETPESLAQGKELQIVKKFKKKIKGGKKGPGDAVLSSCLLQCCWLPWASTTVCFQLQLLPCEGWSGSLGSLGEVKWPGCAGTAAAVGGATRGTAPEWRG